MNKSPLQVDGLKTEFRMRGYTVHAVNGVSYEVHPGEIVGVVGESGCGKSVSQMSVMRLIPEPPGHISGGSASFDGHDLLKEEKDGEYIRSVRGAKIAMIFQEPMTSLNPVMRVGDQIAESLRLHKKLSKAEAKERAIELMKRVRIPDAEERYACFPHEFSGGMCQRVMIAMAMSCEPDVLIADESTTALDVTIQAQILEMLRDIFRSTHTALLIVTHNLGIVARYADRIYVLYAGSIVEHGPAERIFRNPSHAYTIGLLQSVPRLDDAKDRRLAPIEGFPPKLHTPPVGCPFAPRCTQKNEKCASAAPILREVEPGHFTACSHPCLTREQPQSAERARAPKKSSDVLLELRDVVKTFPIQKGLVVKKTAGYVHAVGGVSLKLMRGETLGLVGESGCGKTTLARCILSLHKPTSGQILFDGQDIAHLSERDFRPLRKRIQIIFQDPFASLDPRFKVGDIVGEPLKVHKLVHSRAEYEHRVCELFTMVGLDPDLRGRSPHELSGGQRQRVGIAKALASEPELIVCDEPVSALDVSVQAQILNLLEDLQQKLGLTYIFIAHDLSVVRHISDHIAVMYLGRVVEYGDWKELYDHPAHPYTRALLSAIPIPDPEIEKNRQVETILGDMPSVSHLPSGCCFHPRCVCADASCQAQVPQLQEIAPGHWAACGRMPK